CPSTISDLATLIKMSDPHNYGDKYWCVKSKLSKSGEIYLNADRVEFTPSGGIIFWGGFRPAAKAEDEWKTEKPAELIPCLALAAGQWIAVFAASVMDGHAVAVQHWNGEVVR